MQHVRARVRGAEGPSLDRRAGSRPGVDSAGRGERGCALECSAPGRTAGAAVARGDVRDGADEGEGGPAGCGRRGSRCGGGAVSPCGAHVGSCRCRDRALGRPWHGERSYVGSSARGNRLDARARPCSGSDRRCARQRSGAAACARAAAGGVAGLSSHRVSSGRLRGAGRSVVAGLRAGAALASGRARPVARAGRLRRVRELSFGCRRVVSRRARRSYGASEWLLPDPAGLLAKQHTRAEGGAFDRGMATLDPAHGRLARAAAGDRLAE